MILTIGGKIGVKVLIVEMGMLPEELIVGVTVDVAFVVPFGNPLISSAPIVR